MSTEARDSLRSKAVLNIVDLIGEGQIGGLVNGNQSVFLNDTPLQNPDGTFNFQGIKTDFRNGTNTQSPLSIGNTYVEAPFSAGVKVTKGAPYTLTVNSPEADSIRMIVNIPSLMYTNSTNGDMSGTTVQYKFGISVNGGAFNDVISGNEWVASSNWTTESGMLVAVRNNGGLGIKATAKGDSINGGAGSMIVQPQDFSGGAWRNVGPQKRISVDIVYDYDYYSESYTPRVVADEVSILSYEAKVRFLVISKNNTAGAGDIGMVPLSQESYMGTSVITVSGKSRSKYQRNHILKLPRPASSIRVRMTRITDDTTSAYLSNDTYLDSYSEIVSLNMAYPNSVVAALTVDSEQFAQVPNRAFLVDGLYINVPTNYNPVSRTYSGVWNGTFKLAVSNNPAWILYDLLTNNRYGIGNYVTTAQVDKAMLYSIGKYCDEIVPDGFGGTEPRFTLNTVISSAGEAYKVITDITSAFRGMAFWDGGMVNFTQDSPNDPVQIFSASNVVDGEFTYTGSARKDRHSVVNVTWNDPSDYYRQKVEYVEDRALIEKYGIRKMDTLAFGCTSRGQAARVGKWILYTERYESDMIQFKVGADALFVVPGNIIKIHDSSRAGKRLAGRVVEKTSVYGATLDSNVTLGTGTHTISIMCADGTFVDRTLVETNGTFDRVSWATALNSDLVDNAMWIITEPNLVPMYARVVGVTQGATPTELQISAIEHNPSKFDAIEDGLTLVDRQTSIIDASFVEVPTQVDITESIYLVAPGTIGNRISITWYGNCTQYELSYRGVSSTNNTNWIRARVTDSLSYEIPNANLGLYEIQLTGINPLGKRSATIYKTYTVVGKVNPPSNIADATASTNDSGVLVIWSKINDIDLKNYEVRMASSIGGTWDSATLIAETTNTYLQLDMSAAGAKQFLIKALDTTGHYSAVAKTADVTVLSPIAVTVSSEFEKSNVKLVWPTAKGSFLIRNYEVRVGATFATAASIAFTSAQTFTTPANWLGSQTFWVRATDTFGNIGTASSITVSISQPQAPLLNATVAGDQYLLSWNTPISTLPIEGYEIRTGSSFAAGTRVAVVSGSTFSGKVDWSGNKTFWIAALDTGDNVGTSASATIGISAPSSSTLSSVVSGTNLILSWSAATPGTLAVQDYDIRYGSGSFSSATPISLVKGNTLTIPIDWVGARTFQEVARDVAGNVSVVSTHTVNIQVPSAPDGSSSFLADQFALTWVAPSATLPITEYEVRYGTTWAGSASTAVRIKGTEFRTTAQWGGTRRWWVAAIDANGNVGDQDATDVLITPPSAPSVTQQVVDNNVLLYWSDTPGTLPILTYELRKGATWETAISIGRKSGGFTTVFETSSGSYTYWIAGIDTANNYGSPTALTARVDQPPDYLLKDNYDSEFSGTLSNMYLDVDGGYIMPVNTTETFAEHFTSRSWASPDAQITAGYPVFIQPANSPGYYEEIIDYEAPLASTKVTVTPTGSIISGTPTVRTDISVRTLSSDPWTDYLDVSSIYVGGFRYVKVRLTVTGSDTTLYKLSRLNIRLDSKIKSDTGRGIAGATDAVSGTNAIVNGVSGTENNPLNSNGNRVPDGAGTLVLLNTPLVDISSLEVSVGAGSTAKYAIYDYVDTPYPSGFKVLLYDATGTRVGGNFSWGVRGY